MKAEIVVDEPPTGPLNPATGRWRLDFSDSAPGGNGIVVHLEGEIAPVVP